MDPYNPNATHQQALAWAVSATRGPVVEVGIGWYSTWLLHGLCEGMGRDLISIDPLQEWLDCFEELRSERHALILDDELRLPDVQAGVVFVDHNHPVITRAQVILAARGRADLVVIHDSDPGKQEAYPGVFPCFDGMEDAIGAYEHRRDWRARFPWTTVVWDGERDAPVTACASCGSENVRASFDPGSEVTSMTCGDCGHAE